jgi:hypothetical protein
MLRETQQAYSDCKDAVNQLFGTSYSHLRCVDPTSKHGLGECRLRTQEVPVDKVHSLIEMQVKT